MNMKYEKDNKGFYRTVICELQIPKGGKVKDGQTQSSGSGWKSKNIKMVIVINSFYRTKSRGS